MQLQLPLDLPPLHTELAELRDRIEWLRANYALKDLTHLTASNLDTANKALDNLYKIIATVPYKTLTKC